MTAEKFERPAEVAAELAALPGEADPSYLTQLQSELAGGARHRPSASGSKGAPGRHPTRFSRIDRCRPCVPLCSVTVVCPTKSLRTPSRRRWSGSGER